MSSELIARENNEILVTNSSPHELYFENSGNYVYSIEVDTGHGKLTSYENNIIVSEKQVVTSTSDNDNALMGPNIIPIVLILAIVAFRRKK